MELYWWAKLSVWLSELQRAPDKCFAGHLCVWLHHCGMCYVVLVEKLSRQFMFEKFLGSIQQTAQSNNVADGAEKLLQAVA